MLVYLLSLLCYLVPRLCGPCRSSHQPLVQYIRDHFFNIRSVFVLVFSLNKAKKISLRAHETDGLVKWKDELKSLHGTPELVDRLENLVANHPGIENNIKLYRTLYPFL